MHFPYTLTPDDGEWLVRFPDVPEALTGVCDPDAERQDIADCLIAALASYAAQGEPLPAPSPISDSAARRIAVPALIQAKLMLMSVMAERGVAQRALARTLGVDTKQVQRLLDLDHRSHVGEVEAALSALGRELTVAAA